jgi:hypothetical protein
MVAVIACCLYCLFVKHYILNYVLMSKIGSKRAEISLDISNKYFISCHYHR